VEGATEAVFVTVKVVGLSIILQFLSSPVMYIFHQSKRNVHLYMSGIEKHEAVREI